MPAADQSFTILSQINDRQKMRRQLPVALLHRKIFLVPPHHGHQNLVRQVQEGRIEVTLDHRGKFVQVRDQLQQFGIRMDAEATLLRMRSELTLNLVQPLHRFHDYAVTSKLLLLIAEGPYSDGSRSKKAMAASRVSGGDAAKGKLQQLAVEQANDPADRTDEASATQTSPSHSLWPV